jgi:spermidine synthase
VYIPEIAKRSEGKVSVAEFIDMLREDSEILFHKEGVTTTVTVKRDRKTHKIDLSVDGKIDASTGRDMNTQELLAHVPLMIHPDAKNVLVIGLASGVTVGSSETYPVERIDCVEISPAMIDACHFFDDVNRNALADERCSVIIEDGRNHVTLTDQLYDAIISEPSNPWIAGISSLFTYEFFELCNERLSSEGVMCQWLQSYSLLPEDFKSIVRTFRAAFPHTTVWEPIIGGDYLLIGSKGRDQFKWDDFEKAFRISSVREDLSRIHIYSIADFLTFFVMGWEEIEAFTGEGRLHTDDNLFLEYSAPKSIYKTTIFSHLEELHPYRTSPLKYVAGVPPVSAGEVDANYQARLLLVMAERERERYDHEKISGYLEEAVRFAPNSSGAKHALAEFLFDQGTAFSKVKDYTNSVEVLRKVVDLEPDRHEAWYYLAFSQSELGNNEKALFSVGRALVQAPNTLLYLILKASVLIDRGEYSPAEEVYNDILKQVQEDELVLFHLANLERKMKKTESAKGRLWQLVSLNPLSAEAHYNLASIFSGEGKADSALLLYRRAIRVKPDFALAYYNEGNILVEKGFLRAAVRSYESAILHAPDFWSAHLNLGNTYFRMDHMEKAAHYYQEVLRIDPENQQARHWLSIVNSRIE